MSSISLSCASGRVLQQLSGFVSSFVNQISVHGLKSMLKIVQSSSQCSVQSFVMFGIVVVALLSSVRRAFQFLPVSPILAPTQVITL